MILDTDVWSRLIRRHPDDHLLRESFDYLLRQKTKFFFSSVSIYELSKWLPAQTKTARHSKYARHFTDFRSKFPVLDLTQNDAEAAGHFSLGLRIMGQTVGDADCLLAGQAASRGIPLATYNLRHFLRFLAIDAEALDLRDAARFERVQPGNL